MTEQIDDAMEYIWQKVPKNAQGLIHYLPGDIPYLYENGFVDTTRFEFEEWAAAFEDVRQPDGSYLVSHEKFISLRPFRYDGPVYKPFDPQKVREGEWKKEDLQKLYELSIQPSSSVPEEVFWNSVKALKAQGFCKDGNLVVNEHVKKQLKYLIERFPSPRRKLEIEVNRLREERDTQIQQANKEHDKSLFVAGKLASEVKKEQFKNLETSKTAAAKPKTTAKRETVDIKKLRKPTRKITG
jgi:hypothetical protein